MIRGDFPNNNIFYSRNFQLNRRLYYYHICYIDGLVQERRSSIADVFLALTHRCMAEG